MARRTLLITYIATYLLAVGTIIRYLVRFSDDRFWSIAILLGGYLALILIEPFIIRRSRLLTYIYLFVQTAIICTLSFITPNVDFWAILFCSLVVQVMHNFPQRTGFLITGIFTVIMAILMLLGLDLDVGLPLIFVYGVIYFLLAAFIAIIREAETSNEELRRQQLELQAAHRQLQSYTAQAEELAVLQERNRLARDLHDSVTQSIYSLTLLAEAGQRMIKSGDLRQAEGNQSRLSEIAQQALQEMRLLVYELRPQVLHSAGLIGALEQRLEAVEGRAGIEARLIVDVETDLPADLEEEIYHISIEALNNTLKHTNASEVVLSLRAAEDNLILVVEDNGQGFDPDLARAQGGIGLTSMAERVENIGGQLTIQSKQDGGTMVRAIAPMIPARDSADHQEASS